MSKARCCKNCASIVIHPTDNNRIAMTACKVTGGALTPISYEALYRIRDEITLPCFVKEGK